MATRQKLRDFLAEKGITTTDQRIGISVDATDIGPDDRFNRGDDLGVDPTTGDELLGLKNPQDVGGLLGDFLKYIVDLSDNAYKLEGGNVAAVSLDSRRGAGGTGVPLEPSDSQGAESVFVEGGSSARNTLGTVMATGTQMGILVAKFYKR